LQQKNARKVPDLIRDILPKSTAKYQAWLNANRLGSPRPEPD